MPYTAQLQLSQINYDKPSRFSATSKLVRSCEPAHARKDLHAKLHIALHTLPSLCCFSQFLSISEVSLVSLLSFYQQKQQVRHLRAQLDANALTSIR